MWIYCLTEKVKLPVFLKSPVWTFTVLFLSLTPGLRVVKNLWLLFSWPIFLSRILLVHVAKVHLFSMPSHAIVWLLHSLFIHSICFLAGSVSRIVDFFLFFFRKVTSKLGNWSDRCELLWKLNYLYLFSFFFYSFGFLSFILWLNCCPLITINCRCRVISWLYTFIVFNKMALYLLIVVEANWFSVLYALYLCLFNMRNLTKLELCVEVLYAWFLEFSCLKYLLPLSISFPRINKFFCQCFTLLG